MKYLECPRDSWQGLSKFIPTASKVTYLQALLNAGFKHLDMGSLVSPKAVPQLQDTEQVLAQLKVPKDAQLLAIIANEKGLARALTAPNLHAIGYPLSVNETFQLRNTQKTLAESWDLVKEMYQATKGKLNFTIYLSMGFGNPYGDAWTAKDTLNAVEKLKSIGITDIALSDTVGNATAKLIHEILKEIDSPETLGLHLHAKPNDWQDKLECALFHGVTWFEGALAGIGGCPFAEDELLGNLPTEKVLPFLAKQLNEEIPDLTSLANQAAKIAQSYL